MWVIVDFFDKMWKIVELFRIILENCRKSRNFCGLGIVDFWVKMCKMWGICGILRDFLGFFRIWGILRNFVGFFWILRNFAVFRGIFRDFAGFCGILWEWDFVGICGEFVGLA